MTEVVTLEYSEHVCRIISTTIGAVIVGVCGIILFIKACQWITKALDNRLYRLETDRKIRIERARHNILAEREGWRQHDEYLVQALVHYARENHRMREFMGRCKVADLYEKEESNAEGEIA